LRRIAFFISTFLLFSFAACKSDSDVLAEAKGFKITRGEFNNWLETRRLPVKSIKKTKNSQKNYLRRMAVEKLTWEKYQNSERKNDPDLALLEKVVYKNFLAGYYVKDIRENVTFNEKSADISIIKVPYGKLPKKPKGKEALKETGKELMLEVILPSLKKGEAFEKIAKEHSFDFSRKKGGHVGYIAGTMMGEEIASAVKGLKAGEYTRRPVKVRNSLYLVRLNKVTDITNDNIESVVKDKRNRSGLKRYIVSKSVRDHVSSLEKKYSTVNNIDKARFAGAGEVLFKVGDEVFKNSDLDRLIKMFYKLRFGYVPEKMVDKRKKIATAKRIFSERLLCADAENAGVSKKDAFVEKWEDVKVSAITGAYKFSEISSGVSVNDSDVRAEYKKNKDKRYSRRKGKKKVVLPFSKVRESIKGRLFSMKINNLKRKWDSDLVKESGFKVVESKLEGK